MLTMIRSLLHTHLRRRKVIHGLSTPERQYRTSQSPTMPCTTSSIISNKPCHHNSKIQVGREAAQVPLVSSMSISLGRQRTVWVFFLLPRWVNQLQSLLHSLPTSSKHILGRNITAPVLQRSDNLSLEDRIPPLHRIQLASRRKSAGGTKRSSKTLALPLANDESGHLPWHPRT